MPNQDFVDDPDLDEDAEIVVEAEATPAVQAPISTRDPFEGVGGAYVVGEDGKRIRVS